MNRWYSQLFRDLKTRSELEKLKLSEATFSENYQADFSVGDALTDLDVLATINSNNRAQARLVKIARDPKNYSIKIYSLKDSIPLSQSMPVLESMGLEVLIGRPYRIKIGNRNYWINHFTLERGADLCSVDEENIPSHFSELFENIWRQRSENDLFNHLLFSACLEARNIQILRAYTAYLQQIRFPHSRDYIIETLNTYPDITLLLVRAFLGKFDPEEAQDDGWLALYHGSRRATRAGTVGAYSAGALLLDRDNPTRILRRSHEPIMQPTAEFERSGFVDNVVFPTAMIKQGDTLSVYYGAADTYTGVVEFSQRELLAALH